MAKYKSLQTTFLNGDELFNFGGFVPPVLFPDTQPATPTPTPTPTKTPTPTPSTTPASVSPTPTTTPTTTPTQTTTPTITPTQTTTPTITPTNTITPTKTTTPTPTKTPTPSPVVYSEYFGSGTTASLACAAAETLELYSNQPFFTFDQQVFQDSTLTIPAPINSYLSAGDVVYFVNTFYRIGNAVACPAPSPSPTPTMTITPTKTPTPTPTSTPTIFTAEYNAILSRASGLGYAAPSYAQQVLQNQLIVDLKAAGYWAKLGNLYMFKVNLTGGGSSAFTLINWITPANPTCALLLHTGGVNPPVHTMGGWRFTNENYMRMGNNGSSVNNISTTSVRNSEGTYVADFVANSSSGTNAMWSTNNNSWNTALYNISASHRIYRGIGLTDSFDFTGLGFKGATIDGVVTSDTTIFFQNGGTQTPKTKTATDVGIAGGDMFLNFNGGNATSSFSWTSGMWFFGAGLSSGDMPGFQSIITNYMNA